jgi:hypothetical protein
MPRRISPLRLPVVLSTFLAAFVSTRAAHAHRLDAQLFLLPNRTIQVESWFTSGEAAKGAKVQVFDAHERLLSEGQLNGQGIFLFSYGDTPPHTVVVLAGAGHRRVLSIDDGALERAMPETMIAADRPTTETPPVPVPLAQRDARSTVKDVLVGVGFLLALAAFVLSLRNAQKLRALDRPSEKTP